jgi:hypothetical protein
VDAIRLRDAAGAVRQRRLSGPLVLAVPCLEVARLAEQTPRLHECAPELLRLRKLQSRAMASMDLHFPQALPGIPPEHVTLMDDRRFVTSDLQPHRRHERRHALEERRDIASQYALSFVDNYQAWHHDGPPGKTWLNVVAADSDPLSGLDDAAVVKAIVDELRRYLNFRPDQIDWDHSTLRRNADAPLFMNTVGSWQYRPETRTDTPAHRDQCIDAKVSNLFLAGDYCRSKIDVVCLEGAVATGITAARAVARSYGREDAVPEALTPPEVSVADCQRAKVELAPLLGLGRRRTARRV